MADTTKDIWNDDDGQERRPKKRRKLPGILLFFLTLAVVLGVVLVAAYRARQITQGYAPKVEAKDKPGVVALREVAQGEVGLEMLKRVP